MPQQFNTDYLRFDALSIKDKIKQKLSENANFTDHLFEDSNLTTLIDVFSYTFEVLMYYVNHGASEAIFQDAQLYENMNRIVKMLGYNPVGYTSAKTTVSLQTPNGIFTAASKILPKYTSLNTGLTDSLGKPVFYSTVDNYIIYDNMEANNTDKYEFYNGRWKVYDRTFTAAGTAFEEFTLDLINMEDSANPRYIAHPYVHVYVRRDTTYTFYSPISQGTLFGGSFSVAGPDDEVFELRLNENKKYTLKFGDGIHGSKLKENDEIFVVYLESNGPDGKIGAGIINSESEKLQYGIAGLSIDLVNKFLGITDTTSIYNTVITNDELQNVTAENINSSTVPIDIENTDTIRQNAPNWFRMNGRLITARDFEQYISTTYKNDIYDVHVMNNWEYLASFLEWLDKNGKLTEEIRKEYYPYADSCDFNNVYIWTKFKYDIDKYLIERDLLPRKVLTCEPIILDAFDLYLVPGYKYLNDDGTNRYSFTNWDPNIENWIEILKDKNSFVPIEKVKKDVVDTIREFFKPENIKLGVTLNVDDLTNRILSISGVQSIKTVFNKYGDPAYNAKYINGISFAGWTYKIIGGADITIYSSNIKIRDFQFPVLLDSDLENRIKITYESLGQPSVEY